MDIGTGLTVLGATKLLEKLLGPSFDYLGAGLKDWAERRSENVKRIFAAAAERLGPQLEQPGGVPPKLLRGVLLEGSFCEDPLGAEYFGGVLASSRTTDPSDDRGATYLDLVAHLSTYQLRTHYVFYSLVHRLFTGSTIPISDAEGRIHLGVFIPGSYAALVEGGSGDSAEVLVSHSIFGLARHDLVGAQFHFGSAQYLAKQYPKIPGEGLVAFPSVLGVELFLWAHGLGHLAVNQFLRASIPPLEGMSIPDGAQSLTSLVA
jgi:hypothetical protein